MAGEYKECRFRRICGQVLPAPLSIYRNSPLCGIDIYLPHEGCNRKDIACPIEATLILDSIDFYPANTLAHDIHNETGC